MAIMTDDEIELYLLDRWDEDVPGVMWDDSGRTVVDRAACEEHITAARQRVWHKQANELVEEIAALDGYKTAWDIVEKGSRKRPDIQR